MRPTLCSSNRSSSASSEPSPDVFAQVSSHQCWGGLGRRWGHLVAAMRLFRVIMPRNSPSSDTTLATRNKDLIVEQTTLVTLCVNRSTLIQHRGHIWEVR